MTSKIKAQRTTNHARQESARNGYIASTTGYELAGEVITWSSGSGAKTLADLVSALKAAGFDEKLAPELKPRYAFTRACNKLCEERIIRQLDQDVDSIRFQFTKESRANDEYQYTKETTLTLEKATGKITCDLPGLATEAQDALNQAMIDRTTADVTKIVQRIFDMQADLFPLREQGGAYFVPQQYIGIVEQVDNFLSPLGGGVRRLPVPKGTPHGDRTVRETIADGIGRMIAEHEQAVETFGKDTRESTLERAAEAVKLTRYKLEAYKEYLGEKQAELEESLAEAQATLKRRVEHLHKMKDAEFTIECDFCKAPWGCTLEEAQKLPASFKCEWCGKETEIEWED